MSEIIGLILWILSFRGSNTITVQGLVSTPPIEIETEIVDLGPDYVELPVFSPDQNFYLTLEQAIEVMNRAHVPERLQSPFLHIWWGENGGCWCSKKVGDGGLALGSLQIHWYSTWAPWALTHGYLWPGDYDAWWHPVVNFRVGMSVYDYDLSRGNPEWTQWSVKPWNVQIP